MGKIKGSIKNPEMRRIYKELDIWHPTWIPPAADADWFDASQALATGASSYTLTLASTDLTNTACPGWPVVPVLVATDNADDGWTAVSAVVSGVDQFGDHISETVTFTNSSGTWTGTCANAYQSLISVVTSVTGATTTSDTQVIGFAKTYGLGRRIKSSSDVIAKRFDGAADAGTVSAANSTYAIAGTPDGAKVTELLIRSSIYS